MSWAKGTQCWALFPLIMLLDVCFLIIFLAGFLLNYYYFSLILIGFICRKDEIICAMLGPIHISHKHNV